MLGFGATITNEEEEEEEEEDGKGEVEEEEEEKEEEVVGEEVGDKRKRYSSSLKMHSWLVWRTRHGNYKGMC